MNRLAARILVATLKRRASEGWVVIDREGRETYRDRIWDLLVHTYRSIGVKLSSPSAMDEYDLWQVAVKDGEVVAFSLATTTPYGVKYGLTGSNGTSGKSFVRELLLRRKEVGHYAEVSDAVEVVCRRLDIPVVCAADAEKVLRKPLEIDPDGIHYVRNISGVGAHQKILVGRPRGIKTTTWDNPECPKQARAHLPFKKEAWSRESKLAALEHLSNRMT